MRIGLTQCLRKVIGVLAVVSLVALCSTVPAQQKFGGDSLAETRRNCESYLKHVADRGLQVRPNP